jgi:hypothetical protein
MPVIKPGLTTAQLLLKAKARTEGKVEREKANHLLRDLAPHAQTSRATTVKRKDTSPVTVTHDKMVSLKSSHKRSLPWKHAYLLSSNSSNTPLTSSVRLHRTLTRKRTQQMSRPPKVTHKTSPMKAAAPKTHLSLTCTNGLRFLLLNPHGALALCTTKRRSRHGILPQNHPQEKPIPLTRILTVLAAANTVK